MSRKEKKSLYVAPNKCGSAVRVKLIVGKKSKRQHYGADNKKNTERQQYGPDMRNSKRQQYGGDTVVETVIWDT